MSFISKEIKRFGYIEVNNNQILAAQYHFECDSASDLPTQTQFQNDKNVFLFMGSTAHTITDNKKYEMKSDGTWVDMTNAPSTYDASDIIYDNTESGMTATNVQDAIDEIHDLDEMQDRAIAELYAENTRQETEIGVVANAGAKNYCPKETETSTGIGFTADVEVNIPAGTYILSFTGTIAYTASFNAYRALPHSGNILVSKNLLATTGAQSIEFTITEAAKYIAFYHNGNGNSLTNIMIRPAAITDPTFQPFARTNRELTVLTDEDRAALVEIVDSGAKNHCTLASGSNTQPTRWINIPVSDVGAGQWVMSFGTLTSTDTDDNFCQAICFNSSNQQVSNWTNFKRESNTNKTFTTTDNVSYIRLYPANSYATSEGDTVTFTNAMICSKAAWDISHAYQPYRPSYQEMWDAIQALQSGGNRALTMQNLQPTEQTEPEEQEEIDER